MKYWNKKGKYQELYDRLRHDLVPDMGYADTEAGEMIRCLSNVYYDVFNNGGGNLDSGRLGELFGLCYFLDKYGWSLAEGSQLTSNTKALYDISMSLSREEISKELRGTLYVLLDSAADFITLKAAELSGIAMEQS